MIPTVPLRARNRLAGMILAALSDEEARQALTALAGRSELPPGWLEADEVHHREALAERARRAVVALRGRPLDAPNPSLAGAMASARILFDAGLYFEVHELLEPHWQQAQGGLREALQGLIQIGVGYQHLANGNLAGARALLAEGAARLRRAAVPELDAEEFLRGIHDCLRRFPECAHAVPRFPAGRLSP
jgi:hypothetical protein